MAADLLKDVIALPFRGVVRRLTGAAEAEHERRRTIVAAVARRGFLTGWMRAGGCDARVSDVPRDPAAPVEPGAGPGGL